MHVRVNDVVTDWSYALAGFLVSMHAFWFPPANPSNFSHCGYGSVFVCVECYSCSRINEVQVRVSFTLRK